MNKKTRIQKIEDILKQKPIGNKKIKWKDDSVYMNIYKIPLDYLIYNKYNGRILSRTKSLESHGKEISTETKEGKLLIEKLLWDSKPDRNKRTKEDIESKGQLNPGITTKDGIIVDGNRRAMLLNKIDKFDYFEAIILPVTLEENPIEIEKLETSFQMGEDEKLGYNPIEKYLKSKNLKQKGVSVKDIADWMGEKKSIIELWLSIMETMDNYLDYLKYNGVYTQLDGREDHFISLTKWVKIFYGAETPKGFTGYKNIDVNDLETIAFDYIRIKFEGKEFRKMAEGLQPNHFFGNKQIWESFRDKHFENIESIYDKEDNINLDSENLTAYLNSRDDKFKDKAQKLLKDNFDVHITKLKNQQSKDEPVKLINRAIDNISAINKRSENFKKPEVLNQVEQLNQITTEMLQKESPKKVLKQILDLILEVEIKKNFKDKSKLLEYIKSIEKEAYQLEKKIKNLK